MGINMKGRPKRFLFVDEGLSCVCLRKACDSVFALTLLWSEMFLSLTPLHAAGSHYLSLAKVAQWN